ISISLARAASRGGPRGGRRAPAGCSRRSPLGGNGALALEPVERGIERAGVHLERVARAGPDHLRDAVAVAFAPAQRLENQEIERALQQLDPPGERVLPRSHRGCRISTWLAAVKPPAAIR